MHEFAHVSRITPRYTIWLWWPAHLMPIYPFLVADWVDSAFLLGLYTIAGYNKRRLWCWIPGLLRSDLGQWSCWLGPPAFCFPFRNHPHK